MKGLFHKPVRSDGKGADISMRTALGMKRDRRIHTHLQPGDAFEPFIIHPI